MECQVSFQVHRSELPAVLGGQRLGSRALDQEGWIWFAHFVSIRFAQHVLTSVHSA